MELTWHDETHKKLIACCFFTPQTHTHISPRGYIWLFGISGEEFMELFCIFPFVGTLMMRHGKFDEKGHVHTTGFPGTMIVSMVFSDDTNEETGEIEWFNKRERFRNTLWGWTAWDMVCNFGFRTVTHDDDTTTIEVYHYGEYFHGNLPLVSQVALVIFKLHARWLAWSTEHHINHYAFTAESEHEEEMEEESRKNMPLFLLKHYAWSDLMAMLFGTVTEQQQRQMAATAALQSNATTSSEEEDEDSVTSLNETTPTVVDNASFLVRRQSSVTQSATPPLLLSQRQGTARANDSTTNTSLSSSLDSTTPALLPIQEPANQLRIQQDIATDRAAIQTLLVRANTQSPSDVNAVLTRTYSLRKQQERHEPQEEHEVVGATIDEPVAVLSNTATTIQTTEPTLTTKLTTSSHHNKNKKQNAYSVATEAARLRHLTRRKSSIQQHATSNKKETVDAEQDLLDNIQSSVTLPKKQSQMTDESERSASISQLEYDRKPVTASTSTTMNPLTRRTSALGGGGDAL